MPKHKICVRIGEERDAPEQIISGRMAWALEKLVDAGKRGMLIMHQIHLTCPRYAVPDRHGHRQWDRRAEFRAHVARRAVRASRLLVVADLAAAWRFECQAPVTGFGRMAVQAGEALVLCMRESVRGGDRLRQVQL